MKNILIIIFLAFNSFCLPLQWQIAEPFKTELTAIITTHDQNGFTLSQNNVQLPHVYLRAPQADNQALILLPNIALIKTIKSLEYLQLSMPVETKKSLQWHQQITSNATSFQRAPPQAVYS